MKVERINNTVSLISYTVKLVDDSTYLTKTLEVVNNSIRWKNHDIYAKWK